MSKKGQVRQPPPGLNLAERLALNSRPGCGGCRIWIGSVGSRGEAVLTFHYRKIKAHRAALELHMGRPLSPREEAECTCGVKLCIEPTHRKVSLRRRGIVGMTLREVLEHYRRPAEDGSGCVIWTGTEADNGYGQFKLDSVQHAAHVVALELKLGRPILPGLEACHECDRRLCINQGHLHEGTRADNAAEAAARDRVAWGNRHAMAKLRECDIPRIRADTRGLRAIARDYGVHRDTIKKVRARKTWARLS